MPPLSVKQCTRQPVSSLFDTEPLFCFDLISLWLKKRAASGQQGQSYTDKSDSRKAVQCLCFWLVLQVTVTDAPKAHLNSIWFLADAKFGLLLWFLTSVVVWRWKKHQLAVPVYHLFCHGRVQINNPYGVSYPVQSDAHLFISRNILDLHCNLKAII